MLAQSSRLERFLTIQNDFVGYLLLHIPTTSSLMSHRSLDKVDVLTDHFFDSDTTTALSSWQKTEAVALAIPSRDSGQSMIFHQPAISRNVAPLDSHNLKAPLQVFRHQECHVILPFI